METISVGVLLPTSSIKPMGKQFLKAFKKASSEVLNGSGYELEVLPEMIGTGSPDQIDKALDRFFGFHDVELVTGIASRYGMQHSFEKFSKRNVPLVLCGLGEHYIPTQGYNDYVFINSIHLWQQVWYLGYYAGKNLGDNGMIFSSMYDSGYSFSSAFDNGLRAANPQAEFELKLMPMLEPGKLAPVRESFDEVDFAKKDYVFSLLCGEEATLFLEEFKKRNLHHETTLVGLPFLLEPDEKDLSGINVYTTHHLPEKVEDDSFLNNVFKELGDSTGKALALAIMHAGGTPDKENVSKALAAVDGSRTFASNEFPQLNTPIGIVKHVFQEGNSTAVEVIETKVVDLKENESVNISRDEINSSWVNPYVAI